MPRSLALLRPAHPGPPEDEARDREKIRLRETVARDQISQRTESAVADARFCAWKAGVVLQFWLDVAGQPDAP